MGLVGLDYVALSLIVGPFVTKGGLRRCGRGPSPKPEHISRAPRCVQDEVAAHLSARASGFHPSKRSLWTALQKPSPNVCRGKTQGTARERAMGTSCKGGHEPDK